MNLEQEIIKLKRSQCCLKNTLFFDNFIAFPLVGKINTIYVDKALAVSYFWNGASYTQFSGAAGPTNTITQGNTLVEVIDAGTGIINFVVDGVNVGNVEIIAGTPKWTLDGILDPTVYQGSPLTIAQRNALTPSTGYLVYIVDGAIKEYQYYDGNAWKTLSSASSTTVNDTLISTSTTEALSANQGKVLQDTKVNKPTLLADAGKILVVNVTGTDVEFTDADEDEIVTSLIALTGVAPLGAKYGIDTVTGVTYYVSGGNWVESPSIGVSTNIPNSPDSTLAPVSITDKATGGAIGTASLTVDVNSSFIVTQTTAGQTLTLPNPTVATGSRLVTVQSSSSSSTPFTMYSTVIDITKSESFIWDGIAWSKLGTNSITAPLTYGRVNASANLGSITYSAVTGIGSPINFNATVYANGMTIGGGGSTITPSVAGRYRASWLAMASSNEFANDGTYNIVQNGSVVGSVFINQMEVAGVNQTTPFIDVDLVAGQAVTLNYQPTSNDPIAFEKGSYFDLSQLPTGTIQQVASVVYEDNSALLGSSVNIPPASTNASNATDVMSFTLPSAGVWEIKYNIRATTPNQTATSVTGMVGLITNNTNVTESGSEIAIARFQSGSTSGSGNNLTATGSGVTTITTTGAETFKLRAHHDGSANGTQSYNIQSDNNGRTKVSWVKKAGHLPITTTTRVNVICRNKTAQSIPSNSWGNLTNWTEIQDPTNSFNPVTGVFTAPRTASYAFSTGNGFTVNSGNYVGQAVWLNNATQLYNFLIIAPTLAVSFIQTNGVIEMTAGQTLQARTFNGSGTGNNDTPSASNSWFTITEINSTF